MGTPDDKGVEEQGDTTEADQNEIRESDIAELEDPEFLDIRVEDIVKVEQEPDWTDNRFGILLELKTGNYVVLSHPDDRDCTGVARPEMGRMGRTITMPPKSWARLWSTLVEVVTGEEPQVDWSEWISADEMDSWDLPSEWHKAEERASSEEGSSLLSDGVYHYRADEEHSTFLRFYADGRVVVGETHYPGEYGIERLTWKYGQAERGRYVLCNGRLAFSTIEDGQVVAYDGTAQGQTLKLTWHCHARNSSATETYEFVPVEEWDEPG